MAIARIRKNDTVIVVSGNDAGKTGTVVRVDPKKGDVVVIMETRPLSATKRWRIVK